MEGAAGMGGDMWGKMAGELARKGKMEGKSPHLADKAGPRRLLSSRDRTRPVGYGLEMSALKTALNGGN